MAAMGWGWNWGQVPLFIFGGGRTVGVGLTPAVMGLLFGGDGLGLALAIAGVPTGGDGEIGGGTGPKFHSELGSS